MKKWQNNTLCFIIFVLVFPSFEATGHCMTYLSPGATGGGCAKCKKTRKSDMMFTTVESASFSLPKYDGISSITFASCIRTPCSEMFPKALCLWLRSQAEAVHHPFTNQQCDPTTICYSPGDTAARVDPNIDQPCQCRNYGPWHLDSLRVRFASG